MSARERRTRVSPGRRPLVEDARHMSARHVALSFTMIKVSPAPRWLEKFRNGGRGFRSAPLRQAPSGDPKVRSTLASPHFYVNHGAHARTSPTDRASNDARVAVAARREPRSHDPGEGAGIIRHRVFRHRRRGAPEPDVPPSLSLPRAHRFALVSFVQLTGAPPSAVSPSRAGCLQARLRRLLRQVPQEHPQARPRGHQG